jgi:putative endonuclease
VFYPFDLLVYVETFGEVRDAIAREKQLKSYRREKKVALIDQMNPTWAALAETWLPVRRPAPGARAGNKGA